MLKEKEETTKKEKKKNKKERKRTNNEEKLSKKEKMSNYYYFCFIHAYYVLALCVVALFVTFAISVAMILVMMIDLISL